MLPMKRKKQGTRKIKIKSIVDTPNNMEETNKKQQRNKQGNKKRNLIAVSPNSTEEKKKMKMEEQEIVICPIGGEEIIVFEILSRLPIKTLMRFKSVSKNWESLIRTDKFLMDLHLSRSQKSCPSLLIAATPYSANQRVLLSAELQMPTVSENGRVVGGGAICSQPKYSFPRKNRICTLNGLVCFTDSQRHRFRLYNSSTRETTPWITSEIKKREDQKRDRCQYRYCLTLMGHEFGYVSATEEYKVIALWDLNSCYLGSTDDGITRHRLVCEVLNIRENSWRQINIPYMVSEILVSSVSMNGSIYWLCTTSLDPFSYYVLEFNINREKFSKITLHPDFGTCIYYSVLIELDGQLAMYYQNDTTMNMYTLYGVGDKNEQNRDTSITIASTESHVTACGDYYWRKDTFWLPFSIAISSVRHIPRTDMLIIRSLEEDFSFYFYNWKTKTLGSSKVDISELSSLLRATNGKVPPYELDFYLYTPNLSPVN